MGPTSNVALRPRIRAPTWLPIKKCPRVHVANYLDMFSIDQCVLCNYLIKHLVCMQQNSLVQHKPNKILYQHLQHASNFYLCQVCQPQTKQGLILIYTILSGQDLEISCAFWLHGSCTVHAGPTYCLGGTHMDPTYYSGGTHMGPTCTVHADPIYYSCVSHVLFRRDPYGTHVLFRRNPRGTHVLFRRDSRGTHILFRRTHVSPRFY